MLGEFRDHKRYRRPFPDKVTHLLSELPMIAGNMYPLVPSSLQSNHLYQICGPSWQHADASFTVQVIVPVLSRCKIVGYMSLAQDTDVRRVPYHTLESLPLPGHEPLKRLADHDELPRRS